MPCYINSILIHTKFIIQVFCSVLFRINSLPGFSVLQIKLHDVDHQFSESPLFENAHKTLDDRTEGMYYFTDQGLNFFFKNSMIKFENWKFNEHQTIIKYAKFYAILTPIKWKLKSTYLIFTRINWPTFHWLHTCSKSLLLIGRHFVDLSSLTHVASLQTLELQVTSHTCVYQQLHQLTWKW